MDPGRSPRFGDDYTVLVEWRDASGVPVRTVPSTSAVPWNAEQGHPGTILNRYLFDPEITCRGYLRDRDSEQPSSTNSWHTFGMNHSRILQPELPRA